MNKKLLFFSSLIIIFGFALISRSTPKSIISAALQSDLSLNSPSSTIYAISVTDQNLADGTLIPRGAKFAGKTSIEGNNLIIFFDSIETLDGQTQSFIGKLTINKADDKNISGVSAKLGKTLYNQSRSNVLGAIFYNQGDSNSNISILPKGSILKIEVD